MIRRTIENLRNRPKDERVAFAGSVAMGAIVILFLGWALFFVRGLRTSPEAVPEQQTAATTTPDIQATPSDQTTANQDAQVQLDGTSTMQ